MKSDMNNSPQEHESTGLTATSVIATQHLNPTLILDCKTTRVLYFPAVCNPGTHWDENADSCVNCESGTYNPVSYQLKCLPCPPDKPISAADFLSCQGNVKI